MTTCEQCGADAVDARGRCLQCGWRSPESALLGDDSSPSLGETRAADIPATAARPSDSPMGLVERTSQMPQYAPISQPHGTTPRSGTQLSQTATSRYCGTCGARIEGGEAFCGQCGMPVGMATGEFNTSMNLPGGSPSRYAVGSNTGWTPAAGDAPTEAFVLSQRPAYGRQPTLLPNGQAGYPHTSGATPAAPRSDSSRTVRMVFGLLCIAGSLVSAAAAVILALSQH